MVKKISSCQLRHGNIYMIKSHILFIDMEGTGLGTGLHLWTINLCWCIWNRELFVLETIWPWEVPSAGSVDNKFAICAAEASKPSQSSGPSSESSPTSNPNEDWRSSVRDFNQYQNIKKNDHTDKIFKYCINQKRSINLTCSAWKSPKYCHWTSRSSWTNPFYLQCQQIHTIKYRCHHTGQNNWKYKF